MSDSPRRPWPLVALLFATATAGYLCRTNLSIAGALLMPEFGLTQAQLGRVYFLQFCQIIFHDGKKPYFFSEFS